MQETPSGALTPRIDLPNCSHCGICLEICPGLALELPESVDPFVGTIRAAYVGHATEELVRSRGQSGGVTSALLLFLLETGQIDSALVTTMREDGSLRPRPTLARTRSEILAAQGSKYCPVAANTELRDLKRDQRIAVVGVSCQIQGLHNLRATRHRLSQHVQFTIGLFCDRTLLYTCIDRMAKDANLSPGNVLALQYRSKERNGWPGEVLFQLRSEEKAFFPSSLRTSLKDYFTPPRCRLCFDKANIFSDISVGDSWGISGHSTEGESVLLARTERGMAALDTACRQGYLNLTPIDPALIIQGQGIEQRRRDFSAYSAAWRQMGRNLPAYQCFGAEVAVPVAPGTQKVLGQKLLLNCRVSESHTKRTALAIARNQQRIDRLKALSAETLARCKGIARTIIKTFSRSRYVLQQEDPKQ